MRLSVVIPAHNEEAVIQRCLDTMLRGEHGGDLDVVVVCNGCTDETARAARAFPVRVIELDEASKTAALNAGDSAAAHFPRFYVDADITVTADDLVRAASALSGSVHAVSPAMRPVLNDRPWTVRAFYRVWNDLPYCESLIGAGVYGLDREARMRFDEFPQIIADDLFARLQVRPDERMVAPGTSFDLETPRTVRSLVRVKTRAHLGTLELKGLRPDLFVNEDVDHSRALRTLVRSPGRRLEVLTYVAIRAMSRSRAVWQYRRNSHHRWERDETSRSPGAGDAKTQRSRERCVPQCSSDLHRSAQSLSGAVRTAGAGANLRLDSSPADACESGADRAEPVARVSVLIVSYQSRGDIDRCLRSLLRASAGLDVEVILVDNGSDGTAEHVAVEYPTVKVLPKSGNLGFAQGNNRCAEVATGELLLLLNPDTEMRDSALARLLDTVEAHPEAGVVGGVTRLASGDVDPSCRQPAPGLRSELLQLLGFGTLARGGLRSGATAAHEVPVVSGAFMIVRRDVWQEIEGFDESFWLYSEEVDLCHRVRTVTGRSVMMTPHAEVTHFVGGSSSSRGKRRTAILRAKMHLDRRANGAVHSVVIGSVLWAQAATRVLAGILIWPLAAERARRLRDEYTDAAVTPWRWWSGFPGRHDDGN